MNREKEIGVIWNAIGKNKKKYLLIRLENKWYVGFLNKRKTKKNHPDYLIYFAKFKNIQEPNQEEKQETEEDL